MRHNPTIAECHLPAALTLDICRERKATVTNPAVLVKFAGFNLVRVECMSASRPHALLIFVSNVCVENVMHAALGRFSFAY